MESLRKRNQIEVRIKALLNKDAFLDNDEQKELIESFEQLHKFQELIWTVLLFNFILLN